jgi:hypothetical protein
LEQTKPYQTALTFLQSKSGFFRVIAIIVVALRKNCRGNLTAQDTRGAQQAG